MVPNAGSISGPMICTNVRSLAAAVHAGGVHQFFGQGGGVLHEKVDRESDDTAKGSTTPMYAIDEVEGKHVSLYMGSIRISTGIIIVLMMANDVRPFPLEIVHAYAVSHHGGE